MGLGQGEGRGERMAQAVQMRAPAHYLRVDLEDPAEREYWLVVLDASPEALQRAVAAVGANLWDVRDWLQGQARGTARPSARITPP